MTLAAEVQVFRRDRVDSTNEEARRLLGAGAIDRRAYVLAREQTAGRGTRGRLWRSPRDAGIYLSVVDRPRSPVRPSTGLITRAAGVACAEAIARVTGVRVGLKPINDLIVDGRKLGGILTEALIEAGEVVAIVVGVGVNLKPVPPPGPGDALAPIGLESAAGREIGARDADRLAREIARGVLAWVDLTVHGCAAAVETAWSQRVCPEFAQRDIVPGVSASAMGEKVERGWACSEH